MELKINYSVVHEVADKRGMDYNELSAAARALCESGAYEPWSSDTEIRLREEILRLQHEVANRNARALEGDKARAAFNAEFDRAEQLLADFNILKREANRMADALKEAKRVMRDNGFNTFDVYSPEYNSYIEIECALHEYDRVCHETLTLAAQAPSGLKGLDPI